jgi:HTH-type transcriptional regulator/antitoxin HipB
MTLAELIETRRRERNLTQAELADVVGVDRSDVSRIESGERSVTATTIVALAAALEVPVATLTELAADFERARRERSHGSPSSAAA